MAKTLKTYIKFEDDAHGWVKVSKKEIKRLGIGERISFCSYDKGHYLFLEEDCDMPLWCAAKEHYKEAYTIETQYIKREKMDIRNYPRYIDGILE